MTTATAEVQYGVTDFRLSKDLAKAAETLRPHEARFLVDSYYQMQEDRKRSANQVRSLDAVGEPHAVVSWLTSQSKTLEGQLQRALNIYSKADPVGAWSRSIVGIGPVIAAGLLAMIDIERAPTAGHIWRFAGLDPSHLWLGREKAAALVKEMVPADAKITNEILVRIANHLKRNVESFVRMAANKQGKHTRASLTAALARRPWNANLKTLCVHPDCYITTEHGPTPIKDIHIGDRVLTHKGRFRTVTKVFQNRHEGMLYGLRSANAGNSIAWLTEGHPVYCSPVECWSSGRTLKPNEKTRSPFGWHPVESIGPRWKVLRPIIQENAEPQAIRLSGLKKSGGMVVAEGRHNDVPHPMATEVQETISLNEDTMRFIGLYLAEGHIHRTNVTWSFHENEMDLVEFIREMIRKLTGKNGNISHNVVERSMQITIGCKPLAEKFAELFGSGSLETQFPHSWLTYPKSLLSSLWRGIMEGDGDHVGEYKDKRISTANGRFARQLVDLGRRIGHSVSLHAEKTGKAFRVHVNKRKDETPSARMLLASSYNGNVFNLEVEEDHSYIVEGFAVHNCWKMGESFVKVSGKPEAYYGRVYVQRKEYETAKNAAGDYADQAEHILAEKNIGKDTDAFGHYSEGRLPPAQIHARAKRYAVKLLLAHWHHKAYVNRFNEEPPKPYAIAHLGHTDFIHPDEAS